MCMQTNDILNRLRYALDIKDKEMVEIFALGGVETTTEEVREMLAKVPVVSEEKSNEFVKTIDIQTLEVFLNGLVTLKRGVQEDAPTNGQKQFLMANDHRNVNNILLKKVKIALSLTSEDMIELLQLAGVNLSKSELSAVLRKEGHRNYKECGDRYARNFLKGLALKYRS
ncbi:YehS family protein [Sporosarcina sp. ITBMC105]